MMKIARSYCSDKCWIGKLKDYIMGLINMDLHISLPRKFPYGPPLYPAMNAVEKRESLNI